MTKMDEFNLTELGVFIAGVCASLGALLVIIQKSKCEDVNCCCIKCKRNVQAIIEEERLQKTGHTGSTPQPRRSPRLQEKEIKLELNNNVEDEKP